MLEVRLKAFRYWKEQTEPKWGHVHVPPIDYQAISYYADPLAKKPEGDGKIDPELEHPLGLPLLSRDEPNDVLVQPFLDNFSMYVRGETELVFLLRHLTYVFIVFTH